MQKLISTILLALLLQYGDSTKPNPKPIKLSVYYETLCDDSIRFITTQLYPTYVLFGGFQNPFLEVDLVPYGKAQTKQVSVDGNYTFTCHHGPDECKGNTMQACALKYLPEKQIVEFISCTMKSTNPPEAGSACAKQLSLDFSPVQECLTKDDGQNLLAALGNRTHSLNPTLTYVPWILYNSVFDKDDLDNSQTDLLAVMCKKLKNNGHNNLTQCKKNTNGSNNGKDVQSFWNVILPVLSVILFLNSQ